MLILWWGGFLETRAGESVNIWLHWLNHDLGALWVAVNCDRVRVLMTRPVFFCIVAIPLPAWRKSQEGSVDDVQSLQGRSCMRQEAAVWSRGRNAGTFELHFKFKVMNMSAPRLWSLSCVFWIPQGRHPLLHKSLDHCDNLWNPRNLFVLFFVFLYVVLSADLMNTEVEYLHVQWVLDENCKEPWQNLLCLCDTDGQGCDLVPLLSVLVSVWG